MKYKFYISLILIISYILISFTFAASFDSIFYDGSSHPYTAKDVTLDLNNDKFEPSEGQMPPIILNNRTLVPVREVFEYLTGEVSWDATERKVTIKFEDKEIFLWINKTTAEVNGKSIELDVPAKIVNNKTMVPVRFISENFGLLVDWDQTTYTVSVKFPKANITNIGFTTINGVNCLVATSDKKITGYKYFSLKAEKEEDSFLRLVLDIENCNFKFDTTNATFNSDMLASIRFGNQGNDTNRIVLDLKKDTDYVVVMSKDRLKLYFAMAENFVIPGEEKPVVPENKEPEKTNTTSEVASTPSVNSGDTKTPAKNSGDKIAPSKTSGDNIAQSKNSGDNKTVVKESGDTKTSNKKSGDTIIPSKTSGDKVTKTDSGDTKTSSEIIDVPKPSGENIVIDDNTEIDLIKIDDLEDDEEEVEFDATITSIRYSTATKRIRIAYKGEIKIDDSMLSNPNRIILDFPNTKLETTGPTEIPIKNFISSGIRFSQYTNSSVRVVFDLTGRAEYKIDKRTSEIQIEITESTYKNLKYKKNTSNAQITLQGTKVEDLKVTRYEDMFKYTVEYDTKEYDFGEGKLSPEDKYVKNITVENGIITIVDTGNMTYAIRKSGLNVVITLREKEESEKWNATVSDDENEEDIKEKENKEEKPSTPEVIPAKKSGKKRVLIDVGHGGKDPGACNGDAQEKDFNLNIALNLYNMLKARDDIELYIDRKDDTYLNREDRVEYATNVNPDFIISIHNNSVAKKEYSGTMVLYYNNDTESDFGDITSKECAEIVLEELLQYLGTVDRGVVNRGDLHILSKTPCPSILCEVCFISNDAELERLKTSSFQLQAAQAMYNGVIKILEIM